MRILLVEEEVQTAQYLRRGLVENGFAVDVMGPEIEGFGGPCRAEYDLLVCGAGPGWRGLSEIDWMGRQAPVLFLTDRKSLPSQPDGQATGNYLLKPFAFSDFLARVRGMLRSGPDHAQMTLRLADLELDLVR